ncbi:MAG: ABC transporter permease [Bacteroidales bacterium]|nr:ABC transporter permease [Bacteroidales bacterium]
MKIKEILTIPSLLNIGGIAIAIAAFYVLMSLVDFECTFNYSIKNHSNIYQFTDAINGVRGNYIMRPLPEALASELPSVESYGCLGPWAEWAYYTKNESGFHKVSLRSGWASLGLLDVFGFKILEGDTAKFSDESKIIISRKNAEKYGIKVGDILHFDPQMPDYVEVVAIFEDFEKNTEFAQYGAFKRLNKKDIDNPNQWNYIYYLKMYENSALPQYSPEIKATIRKVVKNLYKDDEEVTDEYLDNAINDFNLEFISLDDLHFHDEINGYHIRTDKRLVFTMLFLAIVIVLIAFINYLNFFFARVPLRLKSINTRKVLGASRGSLIIMLVLESVMYSLIAAALAYLIVLFVIPSVTQGVLNVQEVVMNNYKMLIITTLTTMFVAAATSLYPALYITNIPPALALKGNVTQHNDGKLRQILIGFQVTASIALIISSIFIQKNNDYLLNRELGFDRECLLSTATSLKLAKNPDTVREKLLKKTSIVDIAWAQGQIVAPQRMNWGRPNPENQEETMYVDVFPVSWNFLDFLGVKITEGRNFTIADEQCANGAIIFNETAKKRYNLTLDSKYNGHTGENCDIAGFCEDFNYKPLQYSISSFAFYVFGKESWATLQQLYVRIAKGADIQETVDYIQKTLSEIDPDYEFLEQEIITFDKEVSINYTAENAVAKMITIFTVMAILISVMGIFGIVLFETERRRKEIGIRKVNGATVGEILFMFNRKYLILTVICAALAIPMAYVVISAYFSGYTYHYDINIWPFLLGVLLTATITALVVSSASFRAANENPVKTLKTE